MAEPRRDRWGRYIIPDPETGEDREWTRATTISGILSDRYNLEKWAERMVAIGLSKRSDLMSLVQSIEDPDAYANKKRIDKVCRDAKEAAGSGQASNRGTALHSFTEMVDGGKPVSGIPLEHRADVAAYVETMKMYGLKVLSAETIVVNPAVGVAGTFDRLVQMAGAKLPVILDVKTGKTVDFGHLEHSIQLAIYANATHIFDPETETLSPIPGIDRSTGIIAHMPVGQGRCDLHALDLEAGWRYAQVARQVYDARKRKDLSKPLILEEVT